MQLKNWLQILSTWNWLNVLLGFIQLNDMKKKFSSGVLFKISAEESYPISYFHDYCCHIWCSHFTNHCIVWTRYLQDLFLIKHISARIGYVYPAPYSACGEANQNLQRGWYDLTINSAKLITALMIIQYLLMDKDSMNF